MTPELERALEKTPIAVGTGASPEEVCAYLERQIAFSFSCNTWDFIKTTSGPEESQA